MCYKSLIEIADFDSKVDNAQELIDRWRFNDKYWAEIFFYTAENYGKIRIVQSKDFLEVRKSMNTEYFRFRKIYKEGNYLDINNIWSNLWQKKSF